MVFYFRDITELKRRKYNRKQSGKVDSTPVINQWNYEKSEAISKS